MKRKAKISYLAHLTLGDKKHPGPTLVVTGVEFKPELSGGANMQEAVALSIDGALKLFTPDPLGELVLEGTGNTPGSSANQFVPQAKQLLTDVLAGDERTRDYAVDFKDSTEGAADEGSVKRVVAGVFPSATGDVAVEVFRVPSKLAGKSGMGRTLAVWLVPLAPDEGELGTRLTRVRVVVTRLRGQPLRDVQEAVLHGNEASEQAAIDMALKSALGEHMPGLTVLRPERPSI